MIKHEDYDRAVELLKGLKKLCSKYTKRGRNNEKAQTLLPLW